MPEIITGTVVAFSQSMNVISRQVFAPLLLGLAVWGVTGCSADALVGAEDCAAANCTPDAADVQVSLVKGAATYYDDNDPAIEADFTVSYENVGSAEGAATIAEFAINGFPIEVFGEEGSGVLAAGDTVQMAHSFGAFGELAFGAGGSCDTAPATVPLKVTFDVGGNSNTLAIVVDYTCLVSDPL